MVDTPWTGAWVRDRLGATITTSSTTGPGVPDLTGLALRVNPRRAHLLVSPVLGKHVPVEPYLALAAAAELAAVVGPLLEDVGSSLVIGYAETATALGHEVARTLGAPYLHSTRRPARNAELLSFQEPHSHAPIHRLLPGHRVRPGEASAIVLVDDELSTGRTALATIRALHSVCPAPVYLVAALLDMRDDADRALANQLATQLGVSITVVGLARGSLDLGEDVVRRAATLLDALPVPESPGRPRGHTRRIEVNWPSGVPEGGRHGVTPADEPDFASAVESAARTLAPIVGPSRVHVLGTEELMYLPMRLACTLATQVSAVVTFSSTTRSPIAVLDDPGYAVRSNLVFDAHDDPEDGPGARYAYNLVGRKFDTVVVVVDTASDTPQLVAPGGLLRRLSVVADEVVVVSVPEAVP